MPGAPLQKHKLVLEVSVAHVRVPIWRRVAVSSDTTLHDLAGALQIVLGWSPTDYTLIIEGKKYRGTEDGGSAVPIGLVMTAVGQRFAIERQGDVTWTYDVQYVGTVDDAEATRPRCIDGQGGVPTDEFGGLQQFRDFLDGQTDSSADLRQWFREWKNEAEERGGVWFHEFVIEETNDRLAAMRDEWPSVVDR